MKHIIAYEGKGTVALGVMQEEYVKSFLPWVNWRIGVEGTLQRPPYSHAMGIEWVRGLAATIGRMFGKPLRDRNFGHSDRAAA